MVRPEWRVRPNRLELKWEREERQRREDPLRWLELLQRAQQEDRPLEQE
jgi:hypothetical protein